jgi:magnesium chelatase family protein
MGRRKAVSLCLVQSRALLGLEAPAVTVEVHLANGLPSFTLVGLADTEVKEARERVRSALLNSGLEFPYNKRITVNLAPADLPKDIVYPSHTCIETGRQEARKAGMG